MHNNNSNNNNSCVHCLSSLSFAFKNLYMKYHKQIRPHQSLGQRPACLSCGCGRVKVTMESRRDRGSLEERERGYTDGMYLCMFTVPDLPMFLRNLEYPDLVVLEVILCSVSVTTK